MDIIKFFEEHLGYKLYWYQKRILRFLQKHPYPFYYYFLPRKRKEEFRMIECFMKTFK